MGRQNIFLSSTQIYTKSAETNFITSTELQNVKSSSSNLQTQIDSTQPKFYVVSRIFSNATVSINSGQVTLTSAMINGTTAGVYVFTIPAHPSGSNYMIIATASPNAGGLLTCSAFANSSTSFTVWVYNSSGVLANGAFSFHTIP